MAVVGYVGELPWMNPRDGLSPGIWSALLNHIFLWLNAFEYPLFNIFWASWLQFPNGTVIFAVFTGFSTTYCSVGAPRNPIVQLQSKLAEQEASRCIQIQRF